jgi:hypothetical protein
MTQSSPASVLRATESQHEVLQTILNKKCLHEAGINPWRPLDSNQSLVDERTEFTANGVQMSVSLQAVTFALSIGTDDPFNVSLGGDIALEPAQALVSYGSSSAGSMKIPAPADFGDQLLTIFEDSTRTDRCATGLRQQ